MSEAFSFETRPQLVEQLSSRVFDIAIIGGGITGAALARDAALRGLSVAVVEADDFASGTSSGSTKLLHGGLRYLENLEFGLVRHAIQERELLRKMYSPLVKDLHFVFPTYEKKQPPRWKLNLGLFLYDAFASFREKHKNLTREQCRRQFPLLQTENLTGACVYTDSFAEDFRLVIELIKSAHRKGAICVSQMKAVNILPGKTHQEILLEDRWNGSRAANLKARYLFNCSGPFSDQVRAHLGLKPTLQLTQGVHLVVRRDRLPLNEAFVVSDPAHNRILFAIPWGRTVYLGTTDTPLQDPARAQTHRGDVDYILSWMNRLFLVNLSMVDIIQTWAAVRPLIRPAHEAAPSNVSREHEIVEAPANIFHILGGKLTSHRLMAEEALDHLKERIDLPPGITRYRPLLESPLLSPNVRHSIFEEMALKPIDYLRRRSSLYYENPGLDIVEQTLQEFAQTMKWNDSRIQTERESLLAVYAWDENFRK